MPVSRSAQPEELEPAEDEHQSMPTESLSKAVSRMKVDDEPQTSEEDPARGAGVAAAATTFGSHAAESAAPGAAMGRKRALIQYDYEKAEDNEIELREGEYVTNIEMVDEDWWMGQNSQGETGLFPSNYVELAEDDGDDEPAHRGPAPAQPEEDLAPPPGPPQPHGGSNRGQTATAQYDYEAAEDNELSFPDGAKITNVVSR